MLTTNSLLDQHTILNLSPVIPVVVLQNKEDILPLAETLITAGLKVIEITLRTPAALAAMSLLRQHTTEIIVGAGTVLCQEHLLQCIDAGAQFAVSPGATPRLLEAGQRSEIPLLPGVATLSEIMQGLDYGYHHFKFFPAKQMGGVKMLETFYSLLPNIRFCPTGGINETNFLDYLKLNNVDCVGGSWIVPQPLIHAKNWQGINTLCRSVGEIYHHEIA